MSALGISLKNPIGEASTVAPGISNDDPVAVVGRPKVRFDYPHVLERPGSSVPHENQRATKKVKNKDDMTCMGKENESIRHESFDLTEMDERLAVVGNPHANSTLPSVAPRFSYVGAVSGMKQSTACEFATPLTNEIVVTKDDVKIDNRNMVPSIKFSERVHALIDARMSKTRGNAKLLENPAISKLESIGEEGEQHAFNASKELQPLKEQTYEESQSHIEGVQDGIGIVQSDSVCYMTIHGVFGFSGGILGGDFNSTLSSAERSGGTCYGSGVNALFSEFVFKVGLLDSGFIGPQFT
ncbi:hypothetical protein V6N11_071952 [Hibiscus sabdariffa]|uniref:Uncharacterized protein n=1 Tax=Hibiscus sabdariffa TaxID=183260 RepID=A0ABR2U1N2_9ROSI